MSGNPIYNRLCRNCYVHMLRDGDECYCPRCDRREKLSGKVIKKGRKK